jgi:hypothetical protein
MLSRAHYGPAGIGHSKREGLSKDRKKPWPWGKIEKKLILQCWLVVFFFFFKHSIKAKKQNKTSLS